MGGFSAIQSGVGVSQQGRANVAVDWRWECLFVVSTKLAFIRIDGRLIASGSCD
jgi:hypothetical protein